MCIQTSVEKRPTMFTVASMLKGRLIDVNNDTSTWLLDYRYDRHLLEGGSTRDSSAYEFIIKFIMRIL